MDSKKNRERSRSKEIKNEIKPKSKNEKNLDNESNKDKQKIYINRYLEKYLDSKFNIYIKAFNKKIFKIEVKSSYTILNVKQKIKEFHPSIQKLFLNGKELKDYRTLDDYNIKKVSTLELILINQIELLVKTLTKKTISIKVQISDSILYVKKEIKKYEDFSLEEYSLSFNGKELDDNKKIEDYNIQENSILELVLRVFIQINIKICSGKFITLQAYSSENIYSIKQQIKKKLNIYSDNYYLFFKDTQLEEHKTLYDYNISNKSTLEFKQILKIYLKINDKKIILNV